MAGRKTAVAEPEATPHDLGLRSDDARLDRVRVVANLSSIRKTDHPAREGDIIIGGASDDADSVIMYNAKSGTGGLRFHVLKVHANYACKFDGPDGIWEEGDPEMPPEAARQFNYTLCVPSYDEQLPVVYTASSSAAGAARGLNKALMVHCITGEPHSLCFQMTTKIQSGGKHSWSVPVFKLVEPTADELATAKAMFDMIIGPPRTALSAGEPDY